MAPTAVAAVASWMTMTMRGDSSISIVRTFVLDSCYYNAPMSRREVRWQIIGAAFLVALWGEPLALLALGLLGLVMILGASG